jgi:hypothetical protein
MLAAAASLLFPLPNAPEGEATLAELVPEDALLVASVHDVDALAATARKNAWYRFLADEDVAPFLEYAFEKFMERSSSGGAFDVDEVESELGMTLDEILEALTGSGMFFMGIEGTDVDEGGFMGVTLLLGEDRDGFYELLDATTQLLAAESDTATSTYLGVDITEYGSETYSAYLCEKDDMVSFVLGPGSSALGIVQGTIARHAGEPDVAGFTPNPRRAAARASSATDAQIELFVDLTKFWERIEAEGAFEGETAPPKALTDGVRQIEWIQAGARIDEGEKIDVRLSASWPSTGFLGDLVSLLGPMPRDVFALMPAESISAQATQFDVAGAWDLIVDLLADIEPTTHEQLVASLDELAVVEGIDVEEDFVRQLTGGLGGFTMEVPRAELQGGLGAMTGAMSPDAPPLGAGYVVRVKDPRVVEGFLDDVLALNEMDQSVTSEEFQGQHVHTLDLEGLTKLTWAFTPNAMVVATSPTPVRTALRLAGKEDAPTTLTKPDFAKAIASNRGASMLNVMDTAQTMRSALQTFEAAMRMLPMAAMMAERPELAQSPFGPDTPWPKVEAVDRHFDGIMFTTLTRSSGYLSLRAASQ